MFSSDNGDNWSNEERLAECVLPLGADIMGAHTIIASGSYINVVFNDDRTGSDEIYYKRGTISQK